MTTTKEMVPIKETRRYSETISLAHKEKPRDVSFEFKIAPSVENEFFKKTKMEKSELVLRRESIPVGMKMDVVVEAPREQVTTETIHTFVPPIVHQRRFSETLSIDHRGKPREMVVKIDVPRRPEVSQVLLRQKSAPKPVKLEVEVQEQVLPHQLTSLEILRTKQVEAIETQRQTLNFPIVEHGTPPIFLWQLQSQKVMDGDEVRFTCKVKASPMPQVQWYHNGKIVQDNPDFRMSYNRESGEIVLFIVEVFPQDTGVYECAANNKFGSATTRAQLVVEGFFCIHPIFSIFHLYLS